MAQITHGLRSILSNSIVYSFFQSLMGAHKLRQNFVENRIKPFSGMKILDLGCGPADILEYLDDVEYWGFDMSLNYIEQATKKFGVRGHFECKELTLENIVDLPKFDVVLALGLIHHLDDSIAEHVMKLSQQALKPGGKLFTIDPCFDTSQSIIAKYLIGKDRGQNVRDKKGYKDLADLVFESTQIEVCHQAWIPYTHCYMECQK